MDGVDVYSRLAQGSVVALAAVTHVRVKARLAVERTFRGEGTPAEVLVVFRGVNMARPVKAPPFETREGEHAIFVLAPATDSRGERLPSGALQPACGWRSRIPLPAEGAEALLEAVEAMIALQDDDAPEGDGAALTEWITGRNPWLVDAGLEQAARLGLADRDMAAGLVARAADANPARRRRAAQALGAGLAHSRFGAPARRAGAGVPADEDLETNARETIVRLARTDPDPDVRVAAVQELGRIGPDKTRAVLEAIARDDPSQDVRYEAAAAIARIAPH